MLEDADEGGVRLWHLVKASEEPELPKHRRGSLRERDSVVHVLQAPSKFCLMQRVLPVYFIKFS